MKERDSLAYDRLVKLCRRQLGWLGLSESSRDILALLLVEDYWTNEPLTPEEICDLTGYSRGSMSVILSQLKSLGFIEGQTDSGQKGRGRRRVMYSMNQGLSGLVLFGLRKLRIDLEGMLGEMIAIEEILGAEESDELEVVAQLIEEATKNIAHLREAGTKILSSRATIDMEVSRSTSSEKE
ncbi:MAG: MarR family transcriptional regulator [Candidatus Thorarchaeota archaeon]